MHYGDRRGAPRIVAPGDERLECRLLVASSQLVNLVEQDDGRKVCFLQQILVVGVWDGCRFGAHP